MAIATGVIISAQSSSTAGTTLTLSVPSGVVAGHLVVVWIGFDNTSATAPVVNSITKPAAETGTWTRIASHNSSSASSAGGVRGEMWAIYTTATWGVFNGTITFSASITKKAVSGYSYTGLPNLTIRGTAGTGTSTGGAPTATTTGTTPEIGDLALGGATFENNAMPSIDTDTTGGSWDTGNGTATTGGGAAANVAIIMQHKILTGANHQTYNPTGANDSGAAVVILAAPPDPAITQAASRFYADGSESGSTALAAQDAAPTVDVTSDANVQLRIRLQSTNATAVPSTDDWKLQYEKNNSGTWTNVGTPPTIFAFDGTKDSGSYVSFANQRRGNIFTGNGQEITSVSVYLQRIGSPTGTLRAYIHATSGGVGTGSPLATSSTTRAANSVAVGPAYAAYSFSFSGFTATNGVQYALVIGADAAAESPLPDPSWMLLETAVGSGGSLAKRDESNVWTTLTAWSANMSIYGTEVEAISNFNSTNLTDGAATTSRLTGGTGSFTAGKVSEDSVVDDLGWAGNNHTELLYSMTLKGAQFTNGDTLEFRVVRNGSTTGLTHAQTPTVNINKATVVTQDAYAFYNSGSETGAAILGSQNTPRSHSIDFDQYIQLRVRLQAGATAPPGTSDWQLQYDVNSSNTWINVTAASAGIRATVSGAVTNGAVTTNRLTGGTGTFQAGLISTDGLVDNLGWSSNNFTELLFDLRTVAADLANGDAIRFRISPDTAYSVYPTLNLTKTTTITMQAFRWYADGTEAGSTALANQDIAAGFRTGTTTNVQLRIRLKSDVLLPATADFTLWVSHDPNDFYFVPMTASTDVTYYNSTNLTDGAATTNRLTGGTGSFTAGKISEDAVIDDITWPVANYTEVVFSLTIQNTLLAGAFRYFKVACSVAGSQISWNKLPTIVVGEAIGLPSYRWGKDDGSETSLSLVSGAVPRTPSAEIFLLRYLVLMITQSPAIAATSDWQLQYEKNSSGTWVNVTAATTDIKGGDSALYTDNQTVTSHRLGPSSYLPALFEGKASEDGLVDDMGGVNWLGTTYAEFLYALNVPLAAPLVNGDILKFRVQLNGVTLPDYATTQAQLLVQYPIVRQVPEWGFYDISGTQAAGTLLGGGYGVDLSVTGDFPVQVRIPISNEGGTDVLSQTWQLQYSKNSGAWTNVAGGTDIEPYNAINLTGGAVTTNRIFVPGGGTFVAGRVSETGTTVAVSLIPKDYFTELLYAINVRGSVLAAGDSIRLRVVGSESMQTYTYEDYPTAIKVGPAITQAAYQFYSDGTEAGSTSLAAQSTAPDIDLTSADVNTQLRVRLQSTTAIAVPSTDDFQLQWELNASGTWTNSVLDTLVDTHPLEFMDDGSSWPDGIYAQTFLGNGTPLTKARFRLSRAGDPEGTMTASLYATVGGLNSAPTGSPLATSSTVLNLNTIVEGWTDFNFDGSFTMTDGVAYAIAFTTAGHEGIIGEYYVAQDSTVSHAGRFYSNTGSWTYTSFADLIFEVYGGLKVIGYNSSNLTDGGATTNRLTGGTGSFVAGKVSETLLASDLGWTANNYTEVLYSITVLKAGFADDDVIRFRVLKNGVTTGLTYTQTPTISITKTVTTPATGKLKVWSGSAWVEKPTKVWNGASWVEKTIKYWTGSSWSLLGGGAPPVSIIGSLYVNQNTLETAMTMSLPSGLVDGDRLYIAATCADSSAGVTITESKTGWTTITSKIDQGTTQRVFYTAIYSAGLAAPSWSLSVARKSAYACVAIRNPSASPQVALTDLGSSTTALVAPSVSSAPQGILLRFYVRKDNLSSSVTPPSGGTLVTGALGVATGPSAHILVYSQTPAEPTGTATATFSVASANGSSWTVAV
jgi:hypothetical protein